MTVDLDFLFNKLLEFSNNNDNNSAPIFCVAYKTNIRKPKLFFRNEKIIANEFRDISLEEKYKKHSEYLLIKKIKEEDLFKVNKKYKNLNLIISIPPCKYCKKEIEEVNIFNKIFYLCDYKQEYKIKKLDSKVYKKFVPKNEKQKEIIDILNKKFINFFVKNYESKNK